MFPQRERCEFAGAFGNRIAARLDRPASDTRAYALFAHCFTCGKDLKAANWISRKAERQGNGPPRSRTNSARFFPCTYCMTM